MPQRGITLIEIVVLVVLLAVLVAFFIPTGHRCGGGRKSDCKNTLKQIGIYFEVYHSKFGAYPPPGASTWFRSLWRADMASDGNLFRCACRGKAGSGTHYCGVTGPGTFFSTTNNRSYTWPATGTH